MAFFAKIERVATLTNRKHRLSIGFPLLLAAILLILDQALKFWAVNYLQYGAPPIPVIPWVLEWQLTFNTGAAWSMLSEYTNVLAIGRLFVGIAILIYVILQPYNRLLVVVLTMIASGAIGNAIDGLLNGKVTDMIHAPFLSYLTNALNQGSFPIFNIADMCVVLGTFTMLIVSLIPEKPEKLPPLSNDSSKSVDANLVKQLEHPAKTKVEAAKESVKARKNK